MVTTHRCRRVYRNLDSVLDLRTDAELPVWKAQNTLLRPGCALFINGELFERGINHSDESLAKAKEIANQDKGK